MKILSILSRETLLRLLRPLRSLNSNGTALIESIAVMPILTTLAMGMSVSLLWGWTRLEISSLAQELLVCERSDLQSSECRRQFQTKIENLPGRWKLIQLTPGKHFHQLKLQSSFGGFRYGFNFKEPDPWVQASSKF